MGIFTISAFGDEIDSNLEKQMDVLESVGVRYIEARGVNDFSAAGASESQAKEVRAQMDARGFRMSAVGSPLGKVCITDDLAPHFDLVKRTCENAKIYGTDYVRMFSFYPPEGQNIADYRDAVMENLSKMIDIAKSYGIVLLHENEVGIYGDTADRCLDIMQTLGCDNLKFTFDPANFINSGVETFPYAFEMLLPYIHYMHIKDALMGQWRVVPSGHGDGHLRDILTALKEHDFSGFLSIEPHLGTFEGLEQFELHLDLSKMPQGGPGLFLVAHNALKTILDEISAQYE